jgi:hypothetical protein
LGSPLTRFEDDKLSTCELKHPHLKTAAKTSLKQQIQGWLKLIESEKQKDQNQAIKADKSSWL